MLDFLFVNISSVIVVSEEFDGLPLIKRHRTVNHMLEEELVHGGVHALSIVAKTPSQVSVLQDSMYGSIHYMYFQWDQNSTIPPSPNCLGGSAAEKKKDEESATATAGDAVAK